MASQSIAHSAFALMGFDWVDLYSVSSSGILGEQWDNVYGAHYSIGTKAPLERNWGWATDIKAEAQYHKE